MQVNIEYFTHTGRGMLFAPSPRPISGQNVNLLLLVLTKQILFKHQ